MLKKKLLNHRPLFFILISIVAGVLSAYSFFSSLILEKFNYIIIFYILVFLAFFVLLILFFKNRLKFSFLFKNVCVFFAMFVVSSLISCIYFSRYLNLNFFSGKNVELSGSVSSVTASYSSKIVKLEGIKIKNGNKNYSSPIEASLVLSNYDSFINVGDKLKVACVLDYNYNEVDNLSFNDIINFSEYKGVAEAEDVVEHKNPIGLSKITLSFKNKILTIFNNGMGETNASISYSVLFGDKSKLDSETSDLFSYIGISHVLAVSGLHVGILVGIISFLLKILKCRKKLSAILMLCFLVVYSYLCNFSPSVLRASIMFYIFYISNLLGAQYDKLNSWSLAGIILLLINPLNLFNIGFQLSYVCLFAVFVLAPVVLKCLKKLKLGNFLSNALAMSISINFLTLPIVASSFNKVTLLGVFSNIVVLPLFSCAYTLLFVFLIICLILPFMSFALKLPEVLLHFLRLFCEIIGRVKFGVFNVFSISYFVLLANIAIIWFCSYFFLNAKIKGVVAIPVAFVCLCVFLFNVSPSKYPNKDMIAPFKQYSSNAIVYVSNNRVILVGDVDYPNNLKILLFKNKINHIDDFIISDFHLSSLDNYEKIVNDFNVKNVYLPKSTNTNSLVMNTFKKVKICKIEEFVIENLKFTPIYSFTDNLQGIMIDNSKGDKILYSHLSKKEDLVWLLLGVDENIDYLFVKNLSFNVDNFISYSIKNIYEINKSSFNDSKHYNSLNYNFMEI